MTTERFLALTEQFEQRLSFEHWIGQLRSFYHLAQNEVIDARASYDAWYQAVVDLLDADLRLLFTHWHTGVDRHPGLDRLFQTMLALSDPERAIEARTTYALEVTALQHHGVRYALDQQQMVLMTARQRAFPALQSLPDDVLRAVAPGYKRLSNSKIDDMWVYAGCEPQWWMPPLKTYERQSEYQVAGWLTGLHVYAPTKLAQVLTNSIRAVWDRLEVWSQNYLQTYLRPLPAVPGLSLATFGLHPAVLTAAADRFGAGQWTDAVLAAYRALIERVQQQSGRPDIDGTTLMQQVMRMKDPAILLAPSDQPTEQVGWMSLFVGAVQAIRNPLAHRSNVSYTQQEALEWLMFASALHRALDGAVVYPSGTSN